MARWHSCNVLQVRRDARHLWQFSAGGDKFKLIATDCGAVKDMQAFANQTGNILLATDEANGSYTFYMQKK